MTDDELEDVTLTIGRLWPRMKADEVADLAGRLVKYRAADVHKALDEHKNTNRWPPKPVEMHARLKGREEGAGAATVKTSGASLADVVRRNWGVPDSVKDDELVLRFRRWEWWEYRRRNEPPKGAPVTPAQRAEIDRRLELYAESRKKLAAAAMVTEQRDYAACLRIAAYLDADPGTFRMALADLRGDVFADAPAGVL